MRGSNALGSRGSPLDEPVAQLHVDAVLGRLAELHGQVLRRTALAAKSDFQGLQQAAAWLRRRSVARLGEADQRRCRATCKRMVHLEVALKFATHLSCPRATAFLREVENLLATCLDPSAKHAEVPPEEEVAPEAEEAEEAAPEEEAPAAAAKKAPAAEVAAPEEQQEATHKESHFGSALPSTAEEEAPEGAAPKRAMHTGVHWQQVRSTWVPERREEKATEDAAREVQQAAPEDPPKARSSTPAAARPQGPALRKKKERATRQEEEAQAKKAAPKKRRSKRRQQLTKRRNKRTPRQRRRGRRRRWRRRRRN